ncbi:hsp20/alpha crystallin family domain-containing protein [Phthorimaea operculella]|nr:hsp20/alpha crystallin family domain-containing protein [Phthorimaea operculella]
MELPRLCTTRLFDQNFGMCISPQDILVPFFKNNATNYYRPWKLCDEVAEKDFGSTIDNAKDKLKITLDVQHFLPNEISVKVNDKEIIIEGKHEEKKDEHGFISRQFMRRYTLPKDCLSDSISSTLSSDGLLSIMKNSEQKTECAMKDEKIKTENQILKEEHSRLLKPELLGEAVSSGNTEKLLSESRKETDELLKLMSQVQSMPKPTGEKLDMAIGQCKAAMKELAKEKETALSGMASMASAGMSMASEMTSMMSAETSSMKSTMTSESMQTTMSSSTKTSSEKTSDIVSEIIRAELKEAAAEFT